MQETQTIVIEGDDIYRQRVTREKLNATSKFIKDSISYPILISGLIKDTAVIAGKRSTYITKKIYELTLSTWFKQVQEVDDIYITPSYRETNESAFYEQDYLIPRGVDFHFTVEFDQYQRPIQYYATWIVDGEIYPAPFPNIYNDGTVCLGAVSGINDESLMSQYEGYYEAFLNNEWNDDLYSDRCKFVRYNESKDGTWTKVNLPIKRFTSSTNIISTDKMREIANGLSI